MSYLTDFEYHWSNLEETIRFQMGRLMDKGMQLDLSKANELYQIEVIKWSSMIETPGMWLDGVENPRFASDIRAEMNSFRFRETTEEKKDNNAMIHTLISAGFGILCGILVPFKIIPAMLIGAFIFVLSYFLITKYTNRNQTISEDLRRSYLNELNSHKEELKKICMKYDRNERL